MKGIVISLCFILCVMPLIEPGHAPTSYQKKEML